MNEYIIRFEQCTIFMVFYMNFTSFIVNLFMILIIIYLNKKKEMQESNFSLVGFTWISIHSWTALTV